MNRILDLSWKAPIPRDFVRPDDAAAVQNLVKDAGVFSRQEVETAAELVEERLLKGLTCGYHFLLADIEDRLAAYLCYGPVPLTLTSWDVYWIVTHADYRGCGLGANLLDEAERRIRAAGGRRVYIETSSRDDYKPARNFYLGRGYEQAAKLAEFYGPGDDKWIFLKVLDESERPIPV